MAMYQFPDEEQQWMYIKLLEIVRSPEKERELLIQALANEPEKYLDLLIHFTGSFMKSVRRPAIWVIRAIGYPRNARAIYELIDHFDDVNSPVQDAVAEALLDLGPNDLLRHLLHYFWTMEQKSWGWERILYVCRWFARDEVPREYIVGLGPYLAYLLAQSERLNFREIAPDEALWILEKIGSECAHYALPALVNLVQNSRNKEISERAKRLILSFSQEQLAPYKLIMNELSIIR